MLQTIEILSIIISFSSDSNNLICVLFWSDIAGRTSPVFLGIANAVLMVVLSMFIAATPLVLLVRLWVSQDSLEYIYTFLQQCGILF